MVCGLCLQPVAGIVLIHFIIVFSISFIMKCGCKKTFCSTKLCKCKKAASSCSVDCSCLADKCQNREVAAEEAAAEHAALEWNNVLRDAETERELLISLSRYKVVPKRLQDILKKKRADMDEMKALLEDMNGLAINNQNAEALTEEEWRTFEANLIKCGFCDRKFRAERIQKHEAVCQRRTFVVEPKTTG